MSGDDFTATPDGAAAYAAAHGERDEYKPAYPYGSGNVPRRHPCGCWGHCRCKDTTHDA